MRRGRAIQEVARYIHWAWVGRLRRQPYELYPEDIVNLLRPDVCRPAPASELERALIKLSPMDKLALARIWNRVRKGKI